MKLTLCGSARFEPYWHEANKQLGLAGHICYSLMTFPSVEGSKSWYSEDQKAMLDLAHLLKIDESDGVVMLNIDRYLGESSLRELKWARLKGKEIFWTLDDERRNRYNNERYARILISDNIGDWIELLEAVRTKG